MARKKKPMKSTATPLAFSKINNPDGRFTIDQKVTDDGITKKVDIGVTVQIEDEHESLFPEFKDIFADKKLIETFNTKVATRTPSVANKKFAEINLAHRKKNPAKSGKHKGKVAEIEKYEVDETLLDGTKIKVSRQRWVGGEPRWSQKTLGQLKELVQHVAKGIPAKAVAACIEENGFDIYSVQMTTGQFKAEGNRPKPLAEAQAKADKDKKDASKGDNAPLPAILENSNKKGEPALA